MTTTSNNEGIQIPVNSSKDTPNGICKSGRFWKAKRERFKSVVKTKPLKLNLRKRQKERSERQKITALNKSIKEEKQKKKADLKERQKINKERRLVNEKRGEVVQVINNTSKLKKMSKKQLKYIEKRDTTVINKRY